MSTKLAGEFRGLSKAAANEFWLGSRAKSRRFFNNGDTKYYEYNLNKHY